MLLLTLGLTLFAKTPHQPEQVAFDYFIHEVFSVNYPNVGKLYFSGKTDTSSYHLPFHCDANFNEYNVASHQNQLGRLKSNSINYSTSFIRASIHSKKQKLNLKVYNSFLSGSFYYTAIIVYKRYHFVDRYLIKSSAAGEIAGICRVQEII